MNPDYSRKRDAARVPSNRGGGQAVSHQGSLSRVVAFHKLAVGFIGFRARDDPRRERERESVRAAAPRPHGTADPDAFFSLCFERMKKRKKKKKKWKKWKRGKKEKRRAEKRGETEKVQCRGRSAKEKERERERER